MLDADVICENAASQRALPEKVSKAKTAWVGTAGSSGEHIPGSPVSGSNESVRTYAPHPQGTTLNRSCGYNFTLRG